MAERQRSDAPLVVEEGEVSPRDPTAHEMTPETGTPGFAKGAPSGQALEENGTGEDREVEEMPEHDYEERGSASPDRY